MSNLDYDDGRRMRELCVKLNELTVEYNIAINERVECQLWIDNLLMLNYDNIPESMTIKKQVIKLCTIEPKAVIYHNRLERAKMLQKTLRNRIKNVEAEVNVIKKTYDSTPK